MLYYIPIEPYKTRYTADWIEQFETVFDYSGIDFEIILGKSISEDVTEGGVLDACGTHVYKFKQLSTLMKLIRNGKIVDGDILFFADLWFPGLESLFYVRNMLHIDFKIAGIFHAGTYDRFDFTYRNGMREWGKNLEACWFNDIDYIFVATKFHKKLLLDNSQFIQGLFDKIYVTGIPFYAEELRLKYPVAEKEDIVVFPHRLDEEKHPEKFDWLTNCLKSKGINCKCIKTISTCKDRTDYFKLLAKSKVMVSFADQETFGYSTLEAMALGCIVCVPDRLSYRETVPGRYRYGVGEDIVEIVKDALQNYTEPNYPDIVKWRNAIPNMLEVLKNGI